MNVKLISLPCICRDEHHIAPENEVSNCYHAYYLHIYVYPQIALTFFYGWTALLTPSILCLINFVIVLSMKPVKSVDASQCSLFPVGDLSQMYFI